MPGALGDKSQLFHVWFARYENWRPTGCDAVPPKYRAIDLVVPECLSKDQATHVVEAFNAVMLSDQARLWAIAVPVGVCYHGDLRAGDVVPG
jgi:hypothetical protein